MWAFLNSNNFETARFPLTHGLHPDISYNNLRHVSERITISWIMFAFVCKIYMLFWFEGLNKPYSASWLIFYRLNVSNNIIKHIHSLIFFAIWINWKLVKSSWFYLCKDIQNFVHTFRMLAEIVNFTYKINRGTVIQWFTFLKTTQCSNDLNGLTQSHLDL